MGESRGPQGLLWGLVGAQQHLRRYCAYSRGKATGGRGRGEERGAEMKRFGFHLFFVGSVRCANKLNHGIAY